MPTIRKSKSVSSHAGATTEAKIASPLVIAFEEIDSLDAIVRHCLRKDFRGGMLKNERSLKYHLLALKRSIGNIDRALDAILKEL